MSFGACRRLIGTLIVQRFRFAVHSTVYKRTCGYLSKPSIKSTVGGFSSLALLGFAAKETKKMSSSEELIKQAEQLYKESKFQEIYDLLAPHKDSDDVELLWRFVRASIDLGKLSSDKDYKKKQIYDGFAIMERALKVDAKNAYVQKWYAFALKYTGEYEGTKKQIQNSRLIKEHLEKAAELNPQDPTTLYALGSWAWTFADMVFSYFLTFFLQIIYGL